MNMKNPAKAMYSPIPSWRYILPTMISISARMIVVANIVMLIIVRSLFFVGRDARKCRPGGS